MEPHTAHGHSCESKHFPEQRIFRLMFREEGIQDATELHGCGTEDVTLTMKVYCIHLRGSRGS